MSSNRIISIDFITIDRSTAEGAVPVHEAKYDHATLTDGSNADSLHVHSGGGLEHGNLLGLADDDHTQYHNDARHDARTVNTHSDITSAGADIESAVTLKHDEAHIIASHNDTTATGAELETLTNGSNADALHTHTGVSINTDNRALHVGQAAGISQSVLTTVTTMSSTGVNYITQIMCTGQDNARWEIYIDGSKIATQRTTDRNVNFPFPIPLKVLDGEVVEIKVIFYGIETTATFDATIFGYNVS